MDIATKRVPTLDIRRFDTDRDAFVAELGAAYREFGFCCISGHGINPELIDGAYDAFARFFALPAETKMKYHMPGTGGARGYTPFKIETAKDSHYPDLKEFWHIGREIDRNSKFADVMPPNIWPAEAPGFHEFGYEVFEALDYLGSRVLRALALHIDLPEAYFEDKIDEGNSILRRSTIRRSPKKTFRTYAPARMKTSTSSRCWSVPAPKASKCSRAKATGCPLPRKAMPLW
jgi:isopenicillin N synthase-like dioxygenase